MQKFPTGGDEISNVPQKNIWEECLRGQFPPWRRSWSTKATNEQTNERTNEQSDGRTKKERRATEGVDVELRRGYKRAVLAERRRRPRRERGCVFWRRKRKILIVEGEKKWATTRRGGSRLAISPSSVQCSNRSQRYFIWTFLGLGRVGLVSSPVPCPSLFSLFCRIPVPLRIVTRVPALPLLYHSAPARLLGSLSLAKASEWLGRVWARTRFLWVLATWLHLGMWVWWWLWVNPLVNLEWGCCSWSRVLRRNFEFARNLVGVVWVSWQRELLRWRLVYRF